PSKPLRTTCGQPASRRRGRVADTGEASMPRMGKEVFSGEARKHKRWPAVATRHADAVEDRVSHQQSELLERQRFAGYRRKSLLDQDYARAASRSLFAFSMIFCARCEGTSS